MSLQVVYATQLIERSEGFCENKNRLPYGNFAFVGVRQRPANGKQYFRQWHNARRLVKTIIQVESGFNPNVVSTSNAVGLMQLKASTAGRDAYRMKGRNGQPSSRELKDPAVNIDLGTAYINILQSQQLAGINNPQTLRYATIVSYVNGAGAMLRTFSSDKRVAVNRINQMSPDEFYQHIQKKHPAPQAPRYLWKVTTAYQAMSQ